MTFDPYKDEVIAANENAAIPPYKFNWWGCALVVSSGCLAMYITLKGLFALFFVLGL